MKIIEVNSYLITVDYDYSNFHIKIHCFICIINGGKVHFIFILGI